MSRLKSTGGATRKGQLVLAVGLVGLLLWAQIHYRLAIVIGQSMRPGLSTGDVLLVDKRAYRNMDPQRGDIVLARHDQDLIVKRVVGLPGEEVALHLGRLQVNGSAFAEGHQIEPGRLEISPGKLFPGKFALLGDNRAMGSFEGVHAVVTKAAMIGKVIWALRWSQSTTPNESEEWPHALN